MHKCSSLAFSLTSLSPVLSRKPSRAFCCSPNPQWPSAFQTSTPPWAPGTWLVTCLCVYHGVCWLGWNRGFEHSKPPGATELSGSLKKSSGYIGATTDSRCDRRLQMESHFCTWWFLRLLKIVFIFILFIYFPPVYLFIYFWLCWVFVAVHGLSLVAASGAYSSLRCTGFSLRWLLLLRSTGSRRAGFSSCGTRAQ